LGLHPSVKRRWRSKIIFFYKIVNGLLPDYIYSYLNFPAQVNYSLRSASDIFLKPTPSRTKTFKKTFFPYCINEWNNLKFEVRNAKTINIFKNLIINKKIENSIFSVYDPSGIKLLTRLRLQFSHLNEHKFRHGFTDIINPLCACGKELETNEHFLLRCQLYTAQRLELLGKLEKLDSKFSNLNSKDQVSFLLYGSKTDNSLNLNQNILKNVVTYLKATGRFDKSLISL